MSNDVEIRLRVTENGLEIFDQAGNKMSDFSKAASEAAGETGGGGLKALTKGFADVKAAWDVASSSFSTIGTVILDLNKMGVESLRAKEAFKEMGGAADTIERMQDATRGLADDTVLMQSATHAMSSGAAKSADDLVKIAQIGATLGVTFRDNATTGVMEFTRAIEGVGNVRALRGLGIDTAAVSKEFERLKVTMSDQAAWRMAVLDIAGESAKKLAGNLDGTGTAMERLTVRFEDQKEAIGEWVAEGLDKAAKSVEVLDKYWEALAANPSLTLTVTLNAANDGATSGLNNANNSLTDWLNSEARRLTGQPAKGEHTGEMFGPPKTLAPVSSSGNTALHWLNNAGDQQREDAYRASIGGDQAYWQRRNRATARDTGAMGNEALQKEYVASYEAAHKQAAEMATVKSLMGDITGLAGEYHGKLMAALDPLKKQQDILEQRAKIQSVDDAFGITHDGLYGELGSQMHGAIATRRDKVSQQLRRKIGTGGSIEYSSVDDIKAYDEKAKAERDAYERSIGDPTAEELYKGGDYKKSRMEAYDKTHNTKRKATLRRRKGKVYTQKDYDRDMQQFDRESKEAEDAYAIATGSATKESIKMNDQLESARKNYEDGKISLTQYKNELLLLGEAAKSGATSMDQLTQIQIRLNYGLKMGVTKTGKTAQSDASLYEEHAGGVKGTSSYAGNGIDNETKPFDNIVVSANKAGAAAQQVGTKGAEAIATLVNSSILAVSQFGQMHDGANTALQTIVKLKTELTMLASLSVTINSTKKGGSDNTTVPARGMR